MTKSALVTGGTSGIGRATARALHEAGFDVTITFRSNEDQAKSLLNEGEVASIVRLDLSDPQSVDAWVQGQEGSALDVDVLVINAGEILRPSNWREMGIREITETFSVHAIAPILLARKAAAFMEKRGGGRIIFTSSTYGLVGAGPVLAYGAAKASLVSTTYALARDLGVSGITVNCVAPGNIDTPMTAGAGDAVLKWVQETTPVGRLGKAEEVAAQTMYFVNSPFITGQIAVVDGGQVLNM
ncbi:MAG: 3-oxoacyl-ACP reductase [Microbacterium sp.]|nr:3-oxoacyl-ACP reductase [Microbacterium sp.]MBA4346123.1 3-oxoacyl-ACP reductase [Microbacterium sp.]